MKQFYILFLFITSIGFAQIPTNYYDSATGSGYILKTQLKTIVTAGHIDNGYTLLYTGYLTTDNDTFYENDNTVLDMYSENPAGTDPYNYDHSVRNCGSYNSEDDCYNREHIFPQGFFNSLTPMRTDIHHVVPSDGYVNSRRSNFPFGEISSPTWTSLNGSKVGSNTYPGYIGTVFEPIDEFKGDIARMLLYFAVRYEDEVTSGTWDAHNSVPENTLDGTNDQVYETWYINLLYSWHLNDPVSTRETVRNNAAYNYQGNANPFIDHPEYVLNIWGNVLSSSKYDNISNISMYPNPVKTDFVYFSATQDVDVLIYDVLGKQVLIENLTPSKDFINVSNLNKGIYLVKLNSSQGTTTKKLIKQ